MKRILPLLGLLLVLILILLPADLRDTLLTGHWSPIKSTDVDRGYYFRMKVSLIYKGEPQDFNIVVGCNAFQINYKDGSRTSEVGMVPTLFGRRMKDGKGLILRPPESACKGYTAASGKSFMPLVIVFDNADELGFGTAYISGDAYESPVSDLKFVDAALESASRAEFDDFRRDGPHNLVRRETYFSMNAGSSGERAKLGLSGSFDTDELPGIGSTCQAYARFKLPEKSRYAIRKFWPAEHPKYWKPADPKYTEQLIEQINLAVGIEPNQGLHGIPVQRDDGGDFRRLNDYLWFGSYIGVFGVLRKDNTGLLGTGQFIKFDSLALASYYPAHATDSAHFFPRDRHKFSEFIANTENFIDPKIAFQDGKMRGRGNCYAINRALGAAPDNANGDPQWISVVKKTNLGTVDDQVIAGHTSPGELQFFEDDSYVWVVTQFGLGSVRGDV